MLVSELISMLQEIVADAGDKGEELEIRWAAQPSWPFEYNIGEPVIVGENDGQIEEFEEAKASGELTPEELADGQAEVNKLEENNKFFVYLPEAGQIGYLPGPVCTLLGWR